LRLRRGCLACGGPVRNDADLGDLRILVQASAILAPIASSRRCRGMISEDPPAGERQ
jgi:hypothetical protein